MLVKDAKCKLVASHFLLQLQNFALNLMTKSNLLITLVKTKIVIEFKYNLNIKRVIAEKLL